MKSDNGLFRQAGICLICFVRYFIAFICTACGNLVKTYVIVKYTMLTGIDIDDRNFHYFKGCYNLGGSVMYKVWNVQMKVWMENQC